MDATEKAKWTEEAAADKERFAKENAAYLAKKQPESLEAADNVNPGEARKTANKVEDASGSDMDMDASHIHETMEAALVQSEEATEARGREEASKKPEGERDHRAGGPARERHSTFRRHL